MRTHPMSDKARGALFNILGDIAGLNLIDPFAGTGALSFEAVSRGASHAVTIEHDRPAQRTIQKNIKSLGLIREVKLISATANAWLQTNPDATFDLVLCDPPHDDLQPRLLERLAARVKVGGLVVFSLPPDANIELPDAYESVVDKSYGDMHLAFYRRMR